MDVQLSGFVGLFYGMMSYFRRKFTAYSQFPGEKMLQFVIKRLLCCNIWLRLKKTQKNRRKMQEFLAILRKIG